LSEILAEALDLPDSDEEREALLDEGPLPSFPQHMSNDDIDLMLAAVDDDMQVPERGSVGWERCLEQRANPSFSLPLFNLRLCLTHSAVFFPLRIWKTDGRTWSRSIVRCITSGRLSRRGWADTATTRAMVMARVGASSVRREG